MSYKYTRLRVNGKLIDRHRLVMERKLGRKLESWEIVHHRDDNTKNDHPDNLELTTRSEHAKHHIRAGDNESFRIASPVGVDHYMAKLTETQVRDIRTRLGSGAKGTALAKEYGVHHTLIYQIKSRKIWKHI